MSESEIPHMTALDQMISDDSLQAAKAMIPYTSPQTQQTLSVFIKFWELKKTMQLFEQPAKELHAASLSENQVSPIQMLSAIRQYTSASTRDSIDGLLNALQTIQVFQMYQEMEEEKEIS